MTEPRRYNIEPPPSANKLFRNKTARDNPKAPGRIKTLGYDRWRDLAAIQIKLQHKGPPLDGPTAITLSVRRHHAQADLDNRIKPVLDALQSAGAIANDKQVTCITAAWADHDGCRVTVGPDVS